MSGISEHPLGLGLNQEGLSRLEKIAESGGVVSSYWVTRMADEIRRLRAENAQLKLDLQLCHDAQLEPDRIF